MGYRDGLKLAYVKLDALHALQIPVSSLLGVSSQAEETLNKLGMSSVYDLATSPLFKGAAEIAASVHGEGNSIIARIGRVPNTLIDQDSPATPAALVNADVVMLREIGPQLATEIKNNLQVETIGDLGRWPPFRAAQVILQATVPAQENIDEASELVPKFGEYPTERNFYRSVVIDHVITGDTTDLSRAGPINIEPAISSNFGFKSPAVGAILTFAQSWFAQGMTLGNLLHSVALAPGESTRIAVLDWARRTTAKGVETIGESERLTNVTSHTRAISEVQEAVAKEVQTGFSKSTGSSTTEAAGGGFGLSLGPLTVGGSGSTGTTTTTAESFSSSAGTRNLSATMNQRVSDATQQAASSVRDRRASIVKEVSEEEHETVSTRIIANYNHMHALTVQYFEVIEIYRVTVQLQQAERCLFVPMELVNFTDAAIERYQGVLAAAAINRRAKELLESEFGTVSIEPAVVMRPPKNIFDSISDLDRVLIPATRMRARISERTETPTASEEQPIAPVSPTPATSPMIMTAPNPLIWAKEEIARAARITMVKVTKTGRNTIYLPGSTEIESLSFALQAQNNSPVSLSNVQILTSMGEPVTLTSIGPVDFSLANSIPLQEIKQIRVTSTNTSHQSGRMTLNLRFGSANFTITLPVEISPNATAQQLCRILPNDTSAELKIHLEQHRLHYSQAIWRSLDPSTLSLLLSPFSFEGRPVADQIDPMPIMVAGNYLVFRMPSFVETLGIHSPREAADDSPLAESFKKWHEWLNERGLILGGDAAREQLVPIPTGGVFAEAVLGRSNSAERLDATRFWNWQDSPIPLQPPEIAAIQMGSRTQPTDVSPGQLSSPILNITNPTSLPEPTGVGAIISALQNGSMFRDMSGLASTAGLAQSLSANATSASTEAGRQAAANLAVAAQKDIEEKRIAAQLALAAMGLPSASAGTPKNISESGALLNTANAMDKKTGAQAAGSQSIGSAGGIFGEEAGSEVFEESTEANDFMPGVPEFMEAGAGENRADNVLAKMTWGNLGIPSSNLMLATTGKSTGRRTSTTIIYELACYANFPRPWASEAAEIQGIQNKNWLPASEDFDAISSAATASVGATKPYSQIMSTLEDIIVTVTYFAPKAKGFNSTRPSRVNRLNLFCFAGAQNLEFSGTLKTNGTWVSIFGPTLDLKSTVVDTNVLTNVQTNAANSGTLASLRTAWGPRAEIWLYTAGGVVNDALAQLFATVMGAKVKAFTEPFWVLPRYDATQNTILAREEFGIGADFTAASTTRTKKLHQLDTLATRTFTP